MKKLLALAFIASGLVLAACGESKQEVASDSLAVDTIAVDSVVADSAAVDTWVAK
jgi:ABC-type glycerol-3-phosphate transport system substrate-binding protein